MVLEFEPVSSVNAGVTVLLDQLIAGQIGLLGIIMKSRQLANVLFKVLGFWVCLEAIPSCVSGMLMAIRRHFSSGESFEIMRVTSYGVAAAIQLVIGIIVIAKSQKISSWLFKSDDEN